MVASEASGPVSVTVTTSLSSNTRVLATPGLASMPYARSRKLVFGLARSPPVQERRLVCPRRLRSLSAFPGTAGQDRDSRPDGRLRVSLLRCRLWPAGLRKGRQDHRHRGRPGLPDLARLSLPERRRHLPIGRRRTPRAPCPLPAPARDRLGANSARAGHGHGRRAGEDHTRPDLGGQGQRAILFTGRWESPTSAGPPSTTRRTMSSRSCSPRSESSRSKTRPVFDTPPRSPVWGPRSEEAAPPRSSRICSLPTAS